MAPAQDDSRVSPRQMIFLEDHQGRQEFRVVQRAPPPHEGLRGENPQAVLPCCDAAEMRLPSPDRDDDLPRHAVTLLDVDSRVGAHWLQEYRFRPLRGRRAGPPRNSARGSGTPPAAGHLAACRGRAAEAREGPSRA